MLSNDFHRRLIEESQRGATIDEERKYGVHFDYKDLCARLNSVLNERDKVEMRIRRNNSHLTNKSITKDSRKLNRLSYPNDLQRTTSVNKVQREIYPLLSNFSNKTPGLSSSKNLNRNLSSKPSNFTQTYRLVRNSVYAGKQDLNIKSYDNLHKNIYKAKANLSTRNQLSKSTTIGKITNRVYINKLKAL